MTQHVSSSIVRIGGPQDEPDLWRLFLMAHKENGLFPIDPVKVQWFMHRCLYPERIHPADTGIRGVIGVIGPVEKLEAFALLTIGTFWFSSHKHIEEYVVFVDPECRKSNHAKSLIEWMKLQTDTTGLPLITGVISNTRTEAKCRLYGRLLPKVGEFYAYFGKKGEAAVLATAASS